MDRGMERQNRAPADSRRRERETPLGPLDWKQQGLDCLRPSRPAEESRIMRGKGPGEVNKKNVGSESGWGNLPPKQRDEAMQQIGRDFPAQYREAVEEYFRRLAAEEGGESDK